VEDGKYKINGTHSLKLVDVGGTGNTVPFTLGATLLVVFRDVKEPYRAIVVYDGGFVMNQGSEFITQTMKGFYQAADTADTKLSMITGEGQLNFYDRVLVNGKVLMTDAFVGPSWEDKTFIFNNSASGFDPAYGAITNKDRATVTIDHTGSSSFDCLTGGAWILNTPVVDVDKDGLVDNVEDFSINPNTITDQNPAGDVWRDPIDRPLPDIKAMGASSNHPDLFIEIGAMWAGRGNRRAHPRDHLGEYAVRQNRRGGHGDRYCWSPSLAECDGAETDGRRVGGGAGAESDPGSFRCRRRVGVRHRIRPRRRCLPRFGWRPRRRVREGSRLRQQ
jgi:hypothetical protein